MYKYILSFVNLFLLLVILKLVYGLYLALPSLETIKKIDEAGRSNKILLLENRLLYRKVLQARSNGHILQLKARFLGNYVSENEDFYKVADWS